MLRFHPTRSHIGGASLRTDYRQAVVTRLCGFIGQLVWLIGDECGDYAKSSRSTNEICACADVRNVSQFFGCGSRIGWWKGGEFLLAPPPPFVL